MVGKRQERGTGETTGQNFLFARVNGVVKEGVGVEVKHHEGLTVFCCAPADFLTSCLTAIASIIERMNDN